MTWILERRDRDHTFNRGIKAFPTKPFCPVSFDRAVQGKPCTSEFPLFRLPIELLHHVTPHIPLQDLETLAFIDRDCRQLARSIQFTNVTLSFSDASLGLLDTLLAELSHSHQSSTASSPSLYTLGPCIRHVTVDLGPPLLDDSRLARFPHISVVGAGSSSSCLRKRTAQEIYLDALGHALIYCMPNLQSVDWESRVLLSSGMLDSLMRSPARHVNFTRPIMDPKIISPFYAQRVWGLDALKLDIEWVEDEASERREKLMESDMVEDMLWSVASTLTCFSWKGHRSRNLRQGYRIKDSPNFPNLRALTLQGVLMSDDSVLSAFLSPKTRIQSLALDCPDFLTARFLNSRGYISTLDSFHWKTKSSAFEEEILSFVAENLQLSSFAASPPLSSEFIDSRLLPVIANFRNLTSLHLVWQSTYIPEESLQVISTISSLRRLWFSAGNQGGWCHDWRIDHNLLMDALEPLQFLEILAFSRDSYKTDGHGLLDSSVSKYYVSKALPKALDFRVLLKQDELVLLENVMRPPALTHIQPSLLEQALMVDQAWDLQCKLRSAAWERWHRGQMTLIAREYAMRFPFLEWCYAGQLPISIERESGVLGYEITRILLETSFRTEDVKMLQRRLGLCS